jgi:hypothetical protein
MAGCDGFANALPSSPLGIKAAGLAARGNARAKIFVVSCKWGGGKWRPYHDGLSWTRGPSSKLCSLVA